MPQNERHMRMRHTGCNWATVCDQPLRSPKNHVYGIGSDSRSYTRTYTRPHTLTVGAANCLEKLEKLATLFSRVPTKRVLQSWGVSTTDGRQTRTTWVCRKRCEKSMGATKWAKNPCRGEQEYALVRILPLGASAAGLSDGTPRSQDTSTILSKFDDPLTSSRTP